MAEVNNTTTIGRKGKEDHEKYFNPTVYLNQYYKTPQGNPEEPGFLQFVVDTLHKVYTTGKLINITDDFTNNSVVDDLIRLKVMPRSKI